LTPFLFSLKAKREWGLRRLGVQETLARLDFPEDWSRWLEKAGADRVFVEKQPPMARFVAGAAWWLTSFFNNNNEGRERKNEQICLQPLHSKIEKRRNQAIYDATKYDSKWGEELARKTIEVRLPKWTKLCSLLDKRAETSLPAHVPCQKEVIPTNREEKAKPRNTRKRQRQNLTQPARSTALIEGPVTIHENTVISPVLEIAVELFPDGEAGLMLPQKPVIQAEDTEVKSAEREGGAACRSPSNTGAKSG
jgi:hypothetical protein